jgi:hypothetical protein
MPFNTASSYAFTGISGFSGQSGYSGYSGFSGAYTFFGYTGFSGYTGYTGFSGFASTGSSGYSGFQGAQGAQGGITVTVPLSTTSNVVFSNVTVTSLSTTGVITASAIGTTGVMQQSGNNMIMWVPTVSAFYSERSYVGTLNSQSLQAFTLSGSWPLNARYLLADVYVNQNASSSQIFTIGRWYVNSSSPTTIPGGGAYQPSSYLSTTMQTSNSIRIRIPSSAIDGFWYQNGYWASCQVIPVTGGNTVYVANTQATSVSGWIAMVVKAYSL